MMKSRTSSGDFFFCQSIPFLIGDLAIATERAHQQIVRALGHVGRLIQVTYHLRQNLFSILEDETMRFQQPADGSFYELRILLQGSHSTLPIRTSVVQFARPADPPASESLQISS